MKTLLFFGLFFLTSVTCTDSKNVYICKSNDAKKYHYKENCRGLSSCQYKVVKVTLTEAKSQGKTLCGWED
jgi:5-bromo-4-chloroindolyl phosphate hydrolysis protein